MSVSRLAVAAAVACIAASPAAGASRLTTPALQLKLPQVGLGARRTTHTCQANKRGDRGSARRPVEIAGASRLAVVACEQPPRSELIAPPNLSSAATNGLAGIG